MRCTLNKRIIFLCKGLKTSLRANGIEDNKDRISTDSDDVRNISGGRDEVAVDATNPASASSSVTDEMDDVLLSTRVFESRRRRQARKDEERGSSKKRKGNNDA